MRPRRLRPRRHERTTFELSGNKGVVRIVTDDMLYVVLVAFVLGHFESDFMSCNHVATSYSFH